MTWQPIDTAPKDGTRVDVFSPLGLGRTTDAYYRDGVWWVDVFIDDYAEPNSISPEPTHWMPLPAAPKP